MKRPGQGQRGYSLIELIVVLGIVGILGIAGAIYIGNKPASGVRSILDELEGGLLEAQTHAVATGRDVTLATAGTWDPANPLVLVRGDASIGAAPPVTIPVTPAGYAWSDIFAAAQGDWATLPSPANTVEQQQATNLNVAFRLGTVGTALAKTHVYSGVAVNPLWWGAAQGTSEALTGVPPFDSVAGFQFALTNANCLFTGATNTAFSISGTSKRFNQTFWIPVVSISNGNAVPNGPMGVLFVQGNGGTVYKFYNPGTSHGDGKWRRI